MEDIIYTTSTQYRLFTFTPKQLSELRHATNKAAAEKITESIKSARTAAATALSSSSSSSSSSPSSSPSSSVSPGHSPNDAADNEEIDCPTAAEELKLVAYYCVRCMQLSDHFKFPSNVKATALTFFHRLYLTTSTLTLHPKSILLLILYLATKTENHYTPIESFIATAATAGPVISQEDLLAPEFKVAIGLRWAFQVWHPFRGLEGIFLELNAIAGGRYQSPRGGATEREDARTRLDALLGGDADRVGRAHGGARALLTSTALLTDAYFLYTPAQISFAAFWQADPALAELYIDVKFPPPAAQHVKAKLLDTITECARNHLAPDITGNSSNPYPGLLLQLPQNGIATSVEAATESTLMREVMRIDKKLYQVTNRDKKANEKKGENGVSNGNGNGKYEGANEEKRLKKRRLEREKLDKDGDVFGELL